MFEQVGDQVAVHALSGYAAHVSLVVVLRCAALRCLVCWGVGMILRCQKIYVCHCWK